jgi:ABC-type transporter Mla subunit MlaD
VADFPPDQDSNGDDDTGAPRWVYVFGIIVIVLVLVFVILHLTGGGFGSHMPP